MMEILSMVALLSLYKFLDTPSEPKEIIIEDYSSNEGTQTD